MSKRAWLGAGIIFFDQFTKLLVRGFMCEGETIRIFPFFNLTYINNQGIAFGLFSSANSNYLFMIINIVVLIFLIVNYTKFKNDRFSAIAWTLIIAGAISNLCDRIFLGAVVDFLDFGMKFSQREYRWPVFNIADSSITIGALALFFHLIKRKNNVSNTD